MPSRLSRYCEGIIEASWLAAILLVPVFFNIYSARIFEPDKIALLRSLALVTLAAWIVKRVEEGRASWPGRRRLGDLLRLPLAAPVLATAAACLLATLLSVAPAVSWWGSYARQQGAYTTLAYLVFFAAIATTLRRQAQLDRLLTTAILSSLPVSLYGILQRYQVDPVPWGDEVATRIAANLGNSIFVAAYLIMVFPPTAARALAALRQAFKGRGPAAAGFGRAAIYLLVAALQVLALLFSGSRGPLLGWLAGTFFLLVVVSLLGRRRWLTLAAAATALSIGALLLALNLPNGPLQGLRSSPGIGRLGQLLDAESKTGRVRALIWQGAAELVWPGAPLEYPDGRRDSLNPLRPLVGYGPESMLVVYKSVYPPELAQVEERGATPDRAHNETWDALITTGLLGLAAYLSLFAALFYHGLKGLGWVPDRAWRRRFLGLAFGLGAAFAAGFALWKGAGYLGVGLPFGMAASVIVYLALATFSGNFAPPRGEEERERALILAGLLAALLAHFVEINFGIAIAATRLHFWIFAAALLVAGRYLPLHGEGALAEEADAPLSLAGESAARGLAEAGQSSLRPNGNGSPAPLRLSRAGLAAGTAKQAVASRRGRASPAQASAAAASPLPAWLGQGLAAGALGAMALASLGYAFVSSLAGGGSATALLWNSLARLRGTASPLSYGVLALMLAAWAAIGLAFALESGGRGPDSGRWRVLGVALASSLALGLLYLLWHSAALAGAISMEGREPTGRLLQALRLEGLFNACAAFVLALVFVLGGALAWQLPARQGAMAGRSRWLAPLALLAALWLAAATNLRPVQADVAFKQAEIAAQEQAAGAMADPQGNGSSTAIALARRALDLAPREDTYLLFLGKALLQQARAAEEYADREALLAEARHSLEEAQQIAPLNPDHTANLARLYTTWASLSVDAADRETLARTASGYYERALKLSPNDARLWDEWAALFLELLPRPAEAYPRLLRALELDPAYDWTHGLLGEYYALLAEERAEAAEKRQALERAAGYYAEALRLAPEEEQLARYGYAISLGGVNVRLERLEPAIGAYRQAIAINPQAESRWQVEEIVSRIYAQIGDRENAILHATYALALAPAPRQGALRAWLAGLQGQP